VQADSRWCILHDFVGLYMTESFDAKAILAYQHCIFSVDAGVCIATHDRAGLPRKKSTHLTGQGDFSPRSCSFNVVSFMFRSEILKPIPPTLGEKLR
jgi:hypothetical protein